MVTVSASLSEYRGAPRRRILIYSQYRVLLDGLRSALGNDFDVDTVHNWDSFVRTLDNLDADAAVIGLDVLAEDRSRSLQMALGGRPDLPVVLLSTNGESFDPVPAGPARAARPKALCHAREPLTHLAHCVQRVLNRESLPAEVSRADSADGDPSSKGRLTRRQTEVLRLIANGSGAKEIANVLGISVRTAEFHRAAIMDRLDLHSIALLTRYALRNGIC